MLLCFPSDKELGRSGFDIFAESSLMGYYKPNSHPLETFFRHGQGGS